MICYKRPVSPLLVVTVVGRFNLTNLKWSFLKHRRVLTMKVGDFAVIVSVSKWDAQHDPGSLH